MTNLLVYILSSYRPRASLCHNVLDWIAHWTYKLCKHFCQNVKTSVLYKLYSFRIFMWKDGIYLGKYSNWVRYFMPSAHDAFVECPWILLIRNAWSQNVIKTESGWIISFWFLFYAAIFISAEWTECMAEMLFSFDVCLCVCLWAWDWSIRPVWALNANSCKMVKATDFNFDVHLPRDSPDMTSLKFLEKGAWPGSCEP